MKRTMTLILLAMFATALLAANSRGGEFRKIRGRSIKDNRQKMAVCRRCREGKKCLAGCKSKMGDNRWPCQRQKSAEPFKIEPIAMALKMAFRHATEIGNEHLAEKTLRKMLETQIRGQIANTVMRTNPKRAMAEIQKIYMEPHELSDYKRSELKRKIYETEHRSITLESERNKFMEHCERINRQLRQMRQNPEKYKKNHYVFRTRGEASKKHSPEKNIRELERLRENFEQKKFEAEMHLRANNRDLEFLRNKQGEMTAEERNYKIKNWIAEKNAISARILALEELNEKEMSILKLKETPDNMKPGIIQSIRNRNAEIADLKTNAERVGSWTSLYMKDRRQESLTHLKNMQNHAKELKYKIQSLEARLDQKISPREAHGIKTKIKHLDHELGRVYSEIHTIKDHLFPNKENKK